MVVEIDLFSRVKRHDLSDAVLGMQASAITRDTKLEHDLSDAVLGMQASVLVNTDVSQRS